MIYQELYGASVARKWHMECDWMSNWHMCECSCWLWVSPPLCYFKIDAKLKTTLHTWSFFINWNLNFEKQSGCEAQDLAEMLPPVTVVMATHYMSQVQIWPCNTFFFWNKKWNIYLPWRRLPVWVVIALLRALVPAARPGRVLPCVLCSVTPQFLQKKKRKRKNKKQAHAQWVMEFSNFDLVMIIWVPSWAFR